jgi:FHIPEP family
MGDGSALVVDLASPLERFADGASEEARGFRDSLFGYVKQLVADIGIDAEPQLAVQRHADGDQGDQPYRLLMNERKARLRRDMLGAEIDAERLAFVVARDLFENRELLLTPSVVERARDDWSSHGDAASLARLSSADFGKVLTELVRHCFWIAGPRPDHSGEARVRSLVTEPFDGVELFAEAAAARRGSLALNVAVGRDLYDALSKPHPWTASVPIKDISAADLPGVLQSLFYEEIGLVPPALTLGPDAALRANEFVIQLNDLRLPVGRGLGPDEVMVSVSPDRLSRVGVVGVPAVDPPIEGEAVIVQVDDAAAEILRGGQFDVWGSMGFLALALAREMRARPGVFLVSDVVGYGLKELASTHPDLVHAARMRFGVEGITRILRYLLDELVSVQDLRGVLEAAVAVDGVSDVDQSRFTAASPRRGALRYVAPGEEGNDLATYADCVRRACPRLVVSRFNLWSGALSIVRVDERIESRIAMAEVEPLSEDEHRALIRAVEKAFEPLRTRSPVPVILTNGQARRRLRAAIERELPLLSVLSYQEVPPGTKLDTVGWIQSEGGAAKASSG